MTGRLTKALRQEIVREFAVRHNGTFNPALFLEEVRQKGAEHPAHGWFEWDQRKAASAYQVEQAREFVRDLRVTFTIEEVGEGRTISVREVSMPLALSPLDGRHTGGGYYLVDPANPAHLVEHCRQAGDALRAWWGRYRGAAEFAGCSTAAIDEAITKLETAKPPEPVAG